MKQSFVTFVSSPYEDKMRKSQQVGLINFGRTLSNIRYSRCKINIEKNIATIYVIF